MIRLVTLTLALGGLTRGWLTPHDPRADPTLYNIGIGIADTTGPVAGVNMMGYAMPQQINNGIHFRLFSRAFVIDDSVRRIVFVSVDCGMTSQLVKMQVVDRLQQMHGAVYGHENVLLSGTHTHSGPAGYLQYLLYDVTSLGFINATYDAMVEGIVTSIQRAHNNLVPGRIYVSDGELLGSSINRSPSAHRNNPEEERWQYDYETDNKMTLLKFVDEQGQDLGMLNWFAVHPTSMNNTNLLVSGDNKGYASQLFEKAMEPGSLPGQNRFVAAFAQSNCGDVSPNTRGPRCQDTGLPCDYETSTCNGTSKLCVAAGPGSDMVESTKIIGQKQFDKAWELYHNTSAVLLSGPVQFSHQFIDMANFTFLLNDSEVTTCSAALGYSFAAGTIDGPGAFNFVQGLTEELPFWDMVVDFIYPTSNESIVCHEPKPVLLDTGNYNKPFPWHPRIVDTQVGRVGQVLILAVPGEFTTMGGRRLRKQISDTAWNLGLNDSIPVIAGLSNVYTHYITTYEEYEIQRYEGASTIYGPDTLEAYKYQYTYLVESMAMGIPPVSDFFPPDLYEDQISLLPDVIYDTPLNGSDFGDVVDQPILVAPVGATVWATFVAGHPRNKVELESSFMSVERNVNGSYETVYLDSDWSTRFQWEYVDSVLGTSLANVSWEIPEGTTPGTYRLTHTGYYKYLARDIAPYSGATDDFQVVDISAEEKEECLKKLHMQPPPKNQAIKFLTKLFGFSK